MDFIFFGLTVAVLTCYHLWFLLFTLKSGKTVAGFTSKIRKQWVNEMQSKKGGDILAVQTLRNWIFVSTFLGSVSVTLSLAVIQLSLSIAETDMQNPNNPFLSIDTKNLEYKGFTQSIRFFNHVGIAGSIKDEDASNIDTNDVLSHDCGQIVRDIILMLNHGSLFFTMGLRAFYSAIPFVLWFIRPEIMLASSVVMVIALFLGDRPNSKVNNYNNNIPMLPIDS